MAKKVRENIADLKKKFVPTGKEYKSPFAKKNIIEAKKTPLNVK